MARFVVTRAPGPAWEPAKPTREQAGWDEHAAFMDALVEQGVVLLGGSLDELRALLVMQHDDEDRLREQLAAVPWRDAALTIQSIEPWTLWLRHPDAAS